MEYFFAKDGRRLAYEDSGGDKPPALCLGGLTRNSRDFAPIVRRYADRLRVIRLDSRGRGASERAREPLAEYVVPVEAGDALALMDHLGLGPATLIGTSRGGILAMAIAGGAPDRVSGVILNDVGAVVEGRGLLRIMATLGREPGDASFEAAAARLAAENAAGFPGVSAARWLEHARAIYDADPDGRPALSYDPHLKSAVAAAIEGEGGATVTLWPLFNALKTTPVLVVRAENSDVLSRDTVARMRQAHPGLSSIEVRHRGHAPFLDEAEAVGAIDAFLSQHVLSAAPQEPAA